MQQRVELRALMLRVGGQTIEIEAGRTYHIGRHPTNDLILKCNEVSRFHSRIEWVEGAPILHDLRSSNGTFVDGLRLRAPTFLHGGQRILIGSLKIDVEVLEPEPLPALLPATDEELSLFSEFAQQERVGSFERQLTLHRLLLDLESEGRTGTLQLALGVREAEIVFKLGLVVAARCQRMEGIVGLQKILRANGGTYCFRPSFEPREGSLDVSVRDLLRNGPWRVTKRHTRASAADHPLS